MKNIPFPTLRKLHVTCLRTRHTFGSQVRDDSRAFAVIPKSSLTLLY